MSSKITGKYLGGLNIELTHQDSGTKVTTAVAKDSNGDGSSFSPTDLVSAALGSCMLSVIGIIAGKKRLDIAGTYFNAEKEISQELTRISRLSISFHLPSHLQAADRASLEKYAKTACQVHNSLHPEIETNFIFVYDI